MRCVFKLFRRREQRLRRNATHVQTRAAELQRAGRVLPLFDTCDGLAELRCTDGSDVTARACADHDDVKFFGHDNPFDDGTTRGHTWWRAPFLYCGMRKTYCSDGAGLCNDKPAPG
jgi:hypothetical protein